MTQPHLFGLTSLALGLGYLAGYVALDWLSFIDPFAPFGITPWNPPPGLSFVLILLFGQRFLPLLFAAPLLADLLVRHLPFPWSIEIAGVLLNGGFYAAGLAYLLRPRTGFNPALASMRDLMVLLVAAGLSAAAVAMSYVAMLVLAGFLPATDFVAAALQFWVGDVIGIAVVAPCALILLARGRRLRPTAENLMQGVAILAALGIVFGHAGQHHFQLFYLLFLPIIWTAVRGGLETVTLGILVTQVGLILGLRLVPAVEVDVAAFQALMLVLTLTGLIAGVLVNEHRSTEVQLRLHQDSLARLARLGSMGELAAAVAHEINQPLTAAGTYARLVADTLRDGKRDDPSVAETAGKAAAQVERAASVVRRLRALIRLDQTGRAPVQAETILRETLQLVRPQLDRQNVTARVRIEDGLPAVMADLLQIEQVLLNLLRNAAEAIESQGAGGGAIAIDVARDGADAVSFRVGDTGPGFQPSLLDARLPPFVSTKPDGLGIGLALCRSIVEAHGGRLTLGRGEAGALVTFTLPVAEAAHG